MSCYVFTCIIVKPLRPEEKSCFSRKGQEKNIGFQEKNQGKFVLFKQKSGKFKEVCINPDI